MPNESYETFAAQYQKQIEEVYGTAAAGGALRKKHKGRDSKRRVRRTRHFESASFKAFWQRLARKTNYTVAFREDEVIRRANEALNQLTMGDYEAEVVLTRIQGIAASGFSSDEVGRQTGKLRAIELDEMLRSLSYHLTGDSLPLSLLEEVIETKGTNNLDDQRGLTESERIKIKCALKHFDALGIEAKLEYRPYVAPVKDYQPDFKAKLTV